MLVYKIYNERFCYIGATNNFNRRIAQHKYDFKTKRKPYTSHIVMEDPEYKYEILEDNILKEDIVEKELYYINNYPNVVNIRGKIL